MNILYIAYSCDPYKGSEDKIGWCVPVESAKTNCVYVITKEEQRASIEKYLKESPLENIEFYYVDIPNLYKKVYKGFMYSARLNIWNRRALPLAKRLGNEKNIDIIHQITPVEFRAIGKYMRIPRTKFVCGPLGGGESLPNGLREYSKGHKLVELIRSAINYWSRIKLKIARTIERCDYVMFANSETGNYLTSNSKMHTFELFSEIGLRRCELYDMKSTETDKLLYDTLCRNEHSANENGDKKITFLVAGRMIYRKGHEFLLDALKRIPDNLAYECRIVGDGPELRRLQEICESNETLANHIVFTGSIPYNEMEKEYINADVFIMPSIRETTGTVLLEAMSKGIPVITINKFGGAVLLDNESGWLYDGTDKESYINNLKNAILDCILNPAEVKRRGKNAFEKAKQYTWENKCEHYQRIYDELIHR